VRTTLACRKGGKEELNAVVPNRFGRPQRISKEKNAPGGSPGTTSPWDWGCSVSDFVGDSRRGGKASQIAPITGPGSTAQVSQVGRGNEGGEVVQGGETLRKAGHLKTGIIDRNGPLECRWSLLQAFLRIR